ncbi:MAG TPA: PA14 domain-containing protein [Puia sp.]|nr:PA14 domain-containing protein [Puia sp.]
MKTRFTRLLLHVLLIVVAAFCGQTVMGQTGVLDPNDPIVLYNSANPPTMPPANTMKKWVKTTRMSYNTNDFKCYIYNNVQFRLKWPKTFATDPAGTTYPLYLFFHGVGEAGTWTDNEFQLAHGGDVHQKAVNNGTFNGFLLYPQSANSSGGWNQQQLDAIADIITNYLVPEQKVDINRVSVNGLSGGGDATWQFAETHPTIACAVVPMSAANISDIPYANTLKFNPIWLFQGGLDRAPDPSTTIQLVNAYTNVGGDLKYTIFPNDGHNTWDDTWKQTDYFPFMLRGHKANPWALTGRTQFCPSDNINATLGVTAGFDGYQWQKDGTVIQGATSNTIQATAIGTYSCRILRGSTWSVWSPTPVVISIKAPTVSPNIQVNGLASNVVPAPDGSTSVSLMVPTGYTSYVWERVDSPAGNPAILSSTTNILDGATPGQYAVKVTEQFGCSSSFSSPFTVVSASGPNAPAAPINLLVTPVSKTQLKLTWSEVPSQPNPETQFEIYQGASAAGPFKLIGTSPANVDSFAVGNLTPKTTYFYLVRAINATAGSASAGPSSAQTQSDITAPGAAANLRTGAKGLTSVQLIWDAATDDVAVTGYDIYVNGNKAYSVGNVDTFQVNNLVNGQTYTFTVKAKDFAGNISVFSNQLAVAVGFSGLNYEYFEGIWTTLPDFNSLTPLATGNIPNVTLSNAQSNINYGFTFTGFITVPTTGTYSFQTTSVDGSKLYIDVPYSAGATALVNNDGAHSSKTVTSSNKTLTAGVHTFTLTYFKSSSTTTGSLGVKWKIPGSNSYVTIPNSAFIQNVSVSGTVPAAPSKLTAVAASAKKINLSWQDNGTNETGFQIFRSTSVTGPFAVVATVKPNKTTYGDSSLSPSTTYYYRIQSINQSGSSGFDLDAANPLIYNVYKPYTATTLAGIATATLAATGDTTNFMTAVTTTTTNFALQFNGYINITTAGSYTFYTSSDDGSNLILDGTLLVNNDGSHTSQEKSGVRTLTAGYHPIQVNYFQLTSSRSLTVSYAGPGISKRAIPASALVINPANATTQALPALPADPSGLTGVPQGPTHAGLNWTNNAANATGVEVWRSPATNANYELAATLPVTTSYVDSNLANNTLYYYKVRAINEGGNSNFSNEITLTTSNTAVTTVTLSAIANQTTVNDSTLVVPASASSSNAGSAITYTVTGLPAFASLTDNHDGTAALTFKPNSAQIGNYNGIILTATDSYGGATSDTFSVAVSGRNMTTVNVTFNTGSSPITAPNWNGMNAAANAGVSVSNFNDVNGNATTDGITLVSSWDGAYATGMNTGADAGIYPDNVLQNFYFGSTFNPYTFKVTGLSSSKKYALVFFAGYPWTSGDQATYGNMITNYAVGSQTVSLNAANNISNTVQLAGLSPDASGNITVTVSKPLGTAYCLLNDMQILSYDAPASVAALIPPSNLVANGLSGNSIQLSWTSSPDANSGYQIWRSNNPSGTFNLLTTVGTGVTAYTDAALPANSTWFYEVREAATGGQFSAFSNIAGGSTVQYTVNVSMNSQYAASQAAPWNDMNTLITPGFTLSNMTDMNFQPTGINFNLVTPFTSFNDQLGVTTGNNSGVVPDTVMKTFYYNSQGDTTRIRIDGLSRTGVFNFGFYAGTIFSNAPTVGVYQIGNQIVSLNAFNNTSNMVFINGIKPDSNGSVLISFYTDATTPYAMWSSLTIQGMPSPDVVAADSAGTAGVIASSLLNRGVVTADGGNLLDASLAGSLDTASNSHLNTSFGAYPNPFVDNVTVKYSFSKNTGKFTLVITDDAGKVVQKQEFSNALAGQWQQTINLANLKGGIYFIQLQGLPGEKVPAIKLLKVK